MTMDFASLLVADRGQDAIALALIDRDGFAEWLKGRPAKARAVAEAQGFKGEPAQLAILPGSDDGWTAALGVANVDALGPWCLAKAAEALPAGTYRLADGAAGEASLGWLLGQYRFERYRKEEKPAGARVLLTAEPARLAEAIRLARAVAIVRDLVNTAAADMGPAELEAEAAALAKAHGASLTVTRGRELASGFPMIHVVGKAAATGREPRLIELEWGRPDAPRVAIVGKGVCFDTGGLDIKPSAGMRLMKKDMGGAAHALALGALTMEARLPIRLHLLIPAVENAVSADSFRPGDVLATRKGLTVENTNTDAEGRLVLGDALTKAGESEPQLIIDFATLTGAARVALGPDLPAMFASHDDLADALIDAGQDVADPVWRMPLWDGYDEMLKSDIADMVNAAEGAFAGAVTAALFLRRFVPQGTPWAHFDTFAWRAAAKPGRPKGGDALGLRAAWEMLSRRYR